MAAVLTWDNAIAVLHGNIASQSEGAGRIVPIDTTSWISSSSGEVDSRCLLAIDPSGGLLAVCAADRRTVMLFQTENGEKREPIQLEYAAEYLTFSDVDSLILALEDGSFLHIDPKASRSQRRHPAAKLVGTVSAICPLRSDPGRPSSLLVGMTDGRLLSLPDWQTELSHSSLSEEIGNLGFVPCKLALCTPTADRVAVRIEGGPVDGDRRVGLCVACLGADGSFDILALPIDADGRALSPLTGSVRSRTSPRPESPRSIQPASRFAFTSMSLLDRRHSARTRALAVANNGAMVAVLRRERLEIRSLLYTLPQSAQESSNADSSQSLEPAGPSSGTRMAEL